jgi:hypothetical protein
MFPPGPAPKTEHYKLPADARHFRPVAMPASRLLIRTSTSADLRAITAIYSLAVSAGTGTFKDVGRKFGRWLDVVLMQRALGAGATTAPLGAGATTAPLGAGATTAPQVAGATPSPNA